MLCDSGRDNQLRIRSFKNNNNNNNSNNNNNNNKFRGDDETHPGTVKCTDARWRMRDRMHTNASS